MEEGVVTRDISPERLKNILGTAYHETGFFKTLEEKISKNKDSIAERDKQISITQKEVELLKLEIEELKLKAKNPLAQ